MSPSRDRRTLCGHHTGRVLGSVAARLPRVALPFRKRSATQLARPISVSREVLLFVVGCTLAAGDDRRPQLLAGPIRAATAEATNDAETVTQIDAHGIVQPLLTPALLAGSPAAIHALDTAVTEGVLGNRVVRVKIWTAAGTIVYSDEHALIGETFVLGDDESEALESGNTDSEVSDLSRPGEPLRALVRQPRRGVPARSRRRMARSCSSRPISSRQRSRRTRSASGTASFRR